MTREQDRAVLMLMAAGIYAARLQAYMSGLSAKTKDEWHKHRERAMAVAITEALKLEEMVRLDFPLPGDAAP